MIELLFHFQFKIVQFSVNYSQAFRSIFFILKGKWPSFKEYPDLTFPGMRFKKGFGLLCVKIFILTQFNIFLRPLRFLFKYSYNSCQTLPFKHLKHWEVVSLSRWFFLLLHSFICSHLQLYFWEIQMLLYIHRLIILINCSLCKIIYRSFRRFGQCLRKL